MKPKTHFASGRPVSTLFHVVLPSAAFLVIAAIFWVGFSNQRDLTIEDSSEAGGATHLTYSTRLSGGAILKVVIDSVVFLPTQFKATGAKGSIVYPDGFVRHFSSDKANAGWDLSYAGFENGILTETYDDGSTLTLELERGSVGSNGIIGHQIMARYETQSQSQGNIFADQLFVKSDRTSASLSGDAVMTWSDRVTSDWFKVYSKGFELLMQESLIESLDEAKFEFMNGTGKAGKLRITEAGQKIEFLNGIEFAFEEPDG